MPVINLYPAPTPIPLEGLPIEVCGLEKPLRTVSGRELAALQAVTLKVPLICQIFNWSEVVEWEGVRFADFLEAFRIETHPEGYYAIYSRDGVYFETLSVDEARDPRVLLAYKLNAEPLAEANGGPLRLVVPFLQGYKSVKWVGSVRAFRNDPIGIKRLLGQSPTGQLHSEWLARYGITLPPGRSGDPLPISAGSAKPSPAVPAGPVRGAHVTPPDAGDRTTRAQTSLKEILAFIRPNKHQMTRQALEAAGVVSYTTFRVLGRGRQRGLRFAATPEGPPGEIRWKQLAALGQIVRQHRGVEVSFNMDQNVELHWVRKGQISPIQSTLGMAELTIKGFQPGPRVVSCPGTQFCVLAVTNSQGAARELQT